MSPRATTGHYDGLEVVPPGLEVPQGDYPELYQNPPEVVPHRDDKYPFDVSEANLKQQFHADAQVVQALAARRRRKRRLVILGVSLAAVLIIAVAIAVPVSLLSRPKARYGTLRKPIICLLTRQAVPQSQLQRQARHLQRAQVLRPALSSRQHPARLRSSMPTSHCTVPTMEAEWLWLEHSTTTTTTGLSTSMPAVKFDHLSLVILGKKVAIKVFWWT